MLKLNCGFYYKPVKLNNDEDFDQHFLNHLDFAASGNDPLASNYNLDHIRRMKEYGYVYNKKPSELVYMVGLEDFQNNAYRIESRLFVHPSYRRKYWKSPDGYETIKHQINNHVDSCDFLFKSRTAKNPAGFKISARIDNFFKDWNIHDSEIELRYRDNMQWIMYKNLKGSAIDHIEKLYYQV